ncbi:MAG: SDR family oxidoreductase [Alphaproteobacteria bacterium]|nr:SDR family oxidoreductase [Alphaproteobacteria bacterium]
MAKGETILITGGTSVVGKALIPELTAQGYEVVFTSRNKDVHIQGATCVPVDLLKEDGVEALSAQLKNYKISHLINNFRDVDNLKTDDKARPSQAQWLREYQAAVSVPYALSMMLADQGNLKSVINITSVYGITAGNLNLYEGDQRAAPIHYNVAKAAEIHLTKEMAVRLADQNIRVNAVAYGGIKGRADKDFEKRYEALCPFEGMLETSDLIGAVSFLLSDKAAGKITGQTLQVDGGWTLW